MESTKAMNNIAGPPVEGSDFFGRKRDIENLRALLLNHDILLLGPRRTGKTSIARRIMAEVGAEGWRAIEINIASCNDERSFLDKLVTALFSEFATFTERARNALVKPLTAIRDRIKSVSITVSEAGSLDINLHNGDREDWTKVASELISLLGQTKGKSLIYIDELPILMFNILKNDPSTGVQRVRRFLDWFRNDVRSQPGTAGIRWLVSGSVGLDTLVQQHGMADTINSLNHQTLDAFDDKEARDMLGTLAKSYRISLSDDDIRQIVDAIRWPQPYYLQLFFNNFRELTVSRPSTPRSELIALAIDGMIGPGADNDFHYWEQRLSLQLSLADAGHALALLGRTAHNVQGARADNLLAYFHERIVNASAEEAFRHFVRLRDILIRDAYWQADDSTGNRCYSFRLEPLRRWWLRRNSL